MQKKYVNQSMNHRFGRKESSWKAISFVSILAIFIGVLFGSLMIIFFSNNTTKQATVDKVNPVPSNPVDKEKDDPLAITEKELTRITIPPIHAYGVQLGVFSEKENAETMRATLIDKGINSVVLEEGVSFILLAGVFGDEVSAKEAGEKLTDLGIESFVKLIKLEEKEIELIKEKEAVITEIIGVFQTSLKQFDEKIVVKWNQLIEFEDLAHLKEAVIKLPTERDLFLLYVWDYLKNI